MATAGPRSRHASLSSYREKINPCDPVCSWHEVRSTTPIVQNSRRNHTVVPAPAVSCRAASPFTTAISTQPELPLSAISVPLGRSP